MHFFGFIAACQIPTALHDKCQILFVTLTLRYQLDPFNASVDIDYGDGAA